jgi:hypothetical protein
MRPTKPVSTQGAIMASKYGKAAAKKVASAMRNRAFRGAEGGQQSAEIGVCNMIRKLSGGRYRLYSRKVDPKTKRRRNLGTFATLAAAEKHERAVQFFKRHS